MKIPYILSIEFITLIEIINIYLKTFYFFIKTFIYLKKKNDLFIIKARIVKISWNLFCFPRFQEKFNIH